MEDKFLDFYKKATQKPEFYGEDLVALEIENFKCFKELTIIDFKPLTIFCGANSTGKSTIYKALEYLSDSFTLGENKTWHNGLGTPRKHDKPIKIKATFNHQGWGDYFKFNTICGFEDVSKEKLEESASLEYIKSFEYINPGSWLNSFVSIETVDFGKDSNKCISVYIGELKAIEMLVIVPEDDDPYLSIEVKIRINLMNPLLWGRSRCETIENNPQTLDFNELEKFLTGFEENKLSYHGSHIDSCKIVTDEDGWWVEFTGDYQLWQHFDYLFYFGYKSPSLFDYFGGEVFDVYHPSKETQIIDVVYNMVGPCFFEKIQRMVSYFKRIGPLRSRPKLYEEITDSWENGEAAWLEDSEEFVQDVNRWLRKLDLGYEFVPLTQSLEVRPGGSDNVLWQKSKKSASVRDISTGEILSLVDVGAGISQVIPIIVGVKACHSLYIEQPELHLHPKAQLQLGDYFLSSVKDKTEWYQRQLIVETHSEHLILRILRRIREEYEGIKNIDFSVSKNDVSVYYFKKVDGNTEVFNLPITDDGDFSVKWPGGFFDERDEELF